MVRAVSANRRSKRSIRYGTSILSSTREKFSTTSPITNRASTTMKIRCRCRIVGGLQMQIPKREQNSPFQETRKSECQISSTFADNNNQSTHLHTRLTILLTSPSYSPHHLTTPIFFLTSSYNIFPDFKLPKFSHLCSTVSAPFRALCHRIKPTSLCIQLYYNWFTYFIHSLFVA